MSDNTADEHGLYYVTRDGRTRIGLDRLLTEFPEPGAIPRPERDVLAALLSFCIDGLEHLNARERTEIGGLRPDDVTDEQLGEFAAAAERADSDRLHYEFEHVGLNPQGKIVSPTPDVEAAVHLPRWAPWAVRALRDARDENERLRIQMSALHIANDSLAASAAPTGQSDQTQVHNSAIPADNPAFIAHRYGIAHTDCWCARCESEAKDRLIASGQLGSIEALCGFMHLCPDCGNKRCPRAAWHGNDCKSSNRPGQPGSDYPAAPTGQEAANDA